MKITSSWRLRIRRSFAAAAALTMGGATLTLAAAAAPIDASTATVAAAAQEVADGSLEWGVRTSYRSYIAGPIANGQILASDGAVWQDGPGRGRGPFAFSGGSGTIDPQAGTGEVSFDGTVYTAGHDYGSGPILELTLSDPRLRIDGASAELVVDAAYRPFVGASPDIEPPPVETADDLVFGTVDLTGADLTPDADGVVTVENAPVVGNPEAMTAIGWDLFYSAEMPSVALDPVSFSATVAEVPTWEPTLRAFAADGVTPLPETVAPGEEIVVRGSGFDPAANPATGRPPIPTGVPAGVYVVFGRFAEVWQPSAGAPSSARTVIDQRWALPESSLDQVPEQYQEAIRAQWVELKIDGTFEARLTVGENAEAAGAYGVYTYAAGGAAANPAHELAVPVNVEADGDPTTITDATFEWGINNVSQTGSPAGGCGFFVAGISDGTEASYATSDGDVHLLKRLADGRATAVTAENRCTPLVDSLINQRVLFTGGDGTTDPETGETTIAWSGAFTVNSYGGLVPWYVKDPVLTVDAEGHGTITAEIGGFSSSMENPEVKVPLDPEPGVTILELTDVVVGETITGTPVYAGVDYVPLVDPQDPASGRQESSAIPDSVKAADPAWGSWPTPLVDFHYRTGLTSYWHSSGGAADQHKPPLPVLIEPDGELPEFVEANPVTITTQPIATDVVAGGSATFTVVAQSADDLAYQWQRRERGTADIPANWHDVAGATAATLTVSGLTAADHGALYRVKVSGATASATSAVARLSVGDAVAPAWRSEPTAVTTYAGYRADFTASATGFPKPTYQWQASADGGQTWSDYGSPTTAGQLRLTGVAAEQDGLQVRAVASNGVGEDIVSAAAALAVLATPTAPALTLPAGVEYDLTQDVNIAALGGGFPVPPAPVTLAVVDSEVWEARGADFDVRAVSKAWIEVSVFSFTDGFLQAGLYVPAGTLDAAGDYVLATVSTTAGDRTRDAAVPLPLAGSDPQPTDGFLDWGLKESFRNYVEGPIAHGGIEVRDPATTNDDATYRFAEGAGTGDAGDAEVSFAGEVYFWGHDAGSGPQLELTVTEPRIEVAGQTGTLVADVASRSLSDGEVVTYDDVDLARLDFAAAPVTVTDGVISAQNVPATLTADGVPAFADFYPEGTALDPVSFEAPIEDPQPPTPTVTVSEVTNLDPYADVVTVSGSGFNPADLADGLRVGVGVRTSDGSVPELDPAVTVTPGTGGLSAALALVRGALLAVDGAFEVQLVTGQVAPGAELAVHTAPVDEAADPAYTTQTAIAFAAARTPALTVTPTADLAVGQTVEISGSGFAPNRPISIAITANTDQDPSYGWPTGWLGHEVVRASADGTLQRSLTLSGTVTGADGAGADCVEVQCYVAAFSSAQESDATPVDYRADRGQDVFVPVTFTDEDPAPEPTLTITPSTVAQGETVTFSGTGLEPGTTAMVEVDAEPPGPGPDPVGALDWGVKASFRAYVEGPIANGSIEVEDPATRNADGTVRFAEGSGAGDESALQAGFGGTVTFSGHEGALRLEVTDPRVDIDGEAGTLIADVTSRSLESGELEEFDDVALAELDLSAAPVTVADGVGSATAVPATLTAAGAPAFAGFYEAGEELDPVTFNVPLTNDAAALTATPATAPVEVGSATVTAGGTVELAWTVPADFATGTHSATVTAGATTATASFEIDAADPGPDPDPDPDPEPEAAVSVDPDHVERGATATISGSGYDSGEQVTAVIGIDPAESSYSFDNGSGQSVTVSSADDNPLVVSDGRLVVVDGATLAVTLGGLSGSEAPAGFYLMTAVDNGPGEVATPAVGGVDMTGASHTSRWITNEPYAGSEDAVVPIAADGSAETELQVIAADEHTDCAAAPDGCVLYLRADHRAAADRGHDLRVPLQFGTAAEVAALAGTASVELEGTVGADGDVRLEWTVPADFALGAATVRVTGTTSLREAATQFVIVGNDDGTVDGDETGGDADDTAGTASLPDTGGAPWWLAAVAALLLLSGGVALATRPAR